MTNPLSLKEWALCFQWKLRACVKSRNEIYPVEKILYENNIPIKYKVNWYSTLSNYGRNYMFHSIEWNVIVYKNIDNEEFVWYNLTTDNLSFWYKPIY